MRVLFAFNHPHLPEITGGLQTTTHDLCLAIRALGAEAAVLCARATPSSGTTGAVASDDHLGYLVLRAEQPEKALELAAAAWQADAIVVQSGAALTPMLVASLDTGRPTAAYLHNVETHQLGGHLIPDPALLYFANSAFTARRWKALSGIHCSVIPPVVAPEPYRNAMGGSGHQVLFVNPVPIKGVEILFALAEACPDLPFLVLESWPMAPAWRSHCLERAARLGNVEWRASTPDMGSVFAQARVLLMPSVWEESFGRTALEAQLNGLPMLASDRGHLPELVGEAGVTLHPEAPVALWAQALRALYDPVLSAPQRLAARRQADQYVAATPLVVGEFMTQLALHQHRQGGRTSERAAVVSAAPWSAASAVPALAAPPSLALPQSLTPAPADAASAAPLVRVVPRYPSRANCDFYHSCTLADGEEVVGEWDLRPRTFEYLGERALTGQHVLEIGPASGYLSFYMEATGARVTCVEPPMDRFWDFVPCEHPKAVTERADLQRRIQGVRNAFWFQHHQRGSQVEVFEGDPYHLPANFGPFDVGVLASVLLHVRRPLELLQSVADRVQHSIIITDLHLPALGNEPVSRLAPHAGDPQIHTWWHFTPQFFVSALALMGFTQCTVTYHRQYQPAEQREVDLFTVVGERPTPAPDR